MVNNIVRNNTQPPHRHAPAQDSTRDVMSLDGRERHGTCVTCKRPISSVLMDGTEDRGAGWSGYEERQTVHPSLSPHRQSQG